MFKDISSKISNKSRYYKNSLDKTNIIKKIIYSKYSLDIKDIVYKDKSGLLIINTDSKILANEMYLDKKELIKRIEEKGIDIKDLLVK